MIQETVFTEPAMALAAQFPEIDSVALLQLVEAPIVRMAFHEFQEEFWDGMKFGEKSTPNGGVQLDFDELKKDIGAFVSSPANHCCSGGITHSVHYQLHPIASFMSRIYVWATRENLDLPIRCHLADAETTTRILWGILGICINLQAINKFPRPLCPISASKLGSEDQMGDEPVTSSFEDSWFPSWQAWRFRYTALQDSRERSGFVQYWTDKIGLAHQWDPSDSQYSRQETFLAVLQFLDSPGDFGNAEGFEASGLTVVRPSSGCVLRLADGLDQMTVE
ncbi:hypothetical protein F5Y07DRAFT_406069 [Xylaria sp. FL0933]|nr:hypothetical protein F5Y07DRAFT_406069 [Xylaria sp. FL0933]